jgi:hypothetical protein
MMRKMKAEVAALNVQKKLGIDSSDIGFVLGGLVFVVGIGMLKLAAGVIVCGLMVMAFSYVSATPAEKKQAQKPGEVPRRNFEEETGTE